MAKRFPLLKPGKKDTSLPSNHRGISLTCILSKVLEKFVHEQVTDYLSECGALSEDQYGFRKGRSCPDLLLTAVDDWCLAKDAKHYTAVAFVDLSKAGVTRLQEFRFCAAATAAAAAQNLAARSHTLFHRGASCPLQQVWKTLHGVHLAVLSLIVLFCLSLFL